MARERALPVPTRASTSAFCALAVYSQSCAAVLTSSIYKQIPSPTRGLSASGTPLPSPPPTPPLPPSPPPTPRHLHTTSRPLRHQQRSHQLRLHHNEPFPAEKQYCQRLESERNACKASNSDACRATCVPVVVLGIMKLLEHEAEPSHRKTEGRQHAAWPRWAKKRLSEMCDWR